MPTIDQLMKDNSKEQLAEKIMNRRKNGNGNSGALKRLAPIDGQGIKVTTAIEELLLVDAYVGPNDSDSPMRMIGRRKEQPDNPEWRNFVVRSGYQKYKENVYKDWWKHALNVGAGMAFKGKGFGPFRFR